MSTRPKARIRHKNSVYELVGIFFNDCVHIVVDREEEKYIYTNQ